MENDSALPMVCCKVRGVAAGQDPLQKLPAESATALETSPLICQVENWQQVRRHGAFDNQMTIPSLKTDPITVDDLQSYAANHSDFVFEIKCHQN